MDACVVEVGWTLRPHEVQLSEEVKVATQLLMIRCMHERYCPSVSLKVSVAWVAAGLGRSGSLNQALGAAHNMSTLYPLEACVRTIMCLTACCSSSHASPCHPVS
jgi:hypothetical protein